MNFMLNNALKRGVTVCAALAVSATVSAQAPVYDVNASGNVEQRLSVLERMVDSRTEMQHRLQQQLDTMQGEIDELRGSVEEHTYQLEKVLERQRELYLEIDNRVEALKQSGSTGGQANNMPSQSGNNSSAGNATDASSQSSSQGESEAYDKAVNLILKSREYDKAIPAFQSFISRFPNSQYAPNAHYWLGQLLFNKQKWAEAKEQFSIVSTKFSDSTKRPDALLKMGIIAERQGDTSTARNLFKQVVNDYPNSSARKLAESRLGGL
mgnify:CR=1 FL=1